MRLVLRLIDQYCVAIAVYPRGILQYRAVFVHGHRQDDDSAHSYGDIYPVTTLGKLTAAVIAVAGIGLFALPAGIVGSAFVELREQQKAERQGACPHCGKPVGGPHED